MEHTDETVAEHTDETIPSGRDLLETLQRYRAAELAVRTRLRAELNLGESDLEAIRYLLYAAREGRTTNARVLAEHLGISAPSTSALVQRLVEKGHIERRPDPTDRRAVLLSSDGLSHETLGVAVRTVQERMISVAETVPAGVRVEMAGFLDALIGALETSAAEVGTAGFGAAEIGTAEA